MAHALDSEGAPAVAAIVRLVDAVEPMAEETQTLDLSYLQANVETMGLTELQAAQAALEASAPVPSAGDQGVDVTA